MILVLEVEWPDDRRHKPKVGDEFFIGCPHGPVEDLCYGSDTVTISAIKEDPNA